MLTNSIAENGPIDCHVHLVGNGNNGSGCRLNLTGMFKVMARVMLYHNGVPQAALTGNLEQAFEERLVELVRASSLAAAVVLAQDEVYDEQGRELPGVGTFYVPNDYVFAVAARHPELLPACSIHPARPDALDELERCLAKGAVMMKLLPSGQNINCSDRRYTKFWERLASAGLPLLAHTGHEFTVTVLDKSLADPNILRLPLECGVTVIAAHSATEAGLFSGDYFPEFAKMIAAYPNFYGDNSAFNTPINSRGYKLCTDPAIIDRMVYGGDFPVINYGYWAWLRGRIGWSEMRTYQRNPNVLERDYRMKKACGFPEESFTRLWDLLRLSN